MKKGEISEIVGLPAGRFDPGLTEKQLRILVRAAKEGYFREPRETSTAELGDYFGMHKGSLAIQRRRAKYKILNEYAEYFFDDDLSPWIGTGEVPDTLAELAEKVGEVVDEQDEMGVAPR